MGNQPSNYRHTDFASELLEPCLGFLRRQYRVFIAVTSCCIGLGFVYLLAAPAEYTAHAVLLIDSNNARILQPQQPSSELPLDTDLVETQVEILKSDKIAAAVIKDKRLTEDPAFTEPDGGALSRLLGLTSLGAPSDQSASVLTRNAMETFLNRRSIIRIGRTYALVVSYTSRNPARAAAIANGIASAYIVDQLDSKYEATKRASDWLQDRIKELQAQALAADRAVLTFKETNNIIDIGGESSGPGGSARLIENRQLAELSTQLINARVATSEAKARLDRIKELLKLDLPDAAVTDSLKDEVITRLRNQYVDLAAREATLSSRYGPYHQAAVNLRDQMEELRRSVRNELARIAASYSSSYEIAKTSEDDLAKKFAALVAAGQTTNRDRLGLDELESSAKVYHTIYDNFLRLYSEALQQQSFPITQARILSPAAPPTQKSSPVGKVVLSIAGLVGILLSFGVAGIREVMDLSFRRARQVEEALQTRCLAMLPKIKSTPNLSIDNSADRGRAQQDTVPAANGSRTERAVGQEVVPGARALTVTEGLLRYVVDDPLSAFAEGCRAAKLAAELASSSKENKVVGVTSTLPNEGKSTFACNLAELLADAGKRAILVDADLRKPMLAACFAPRPQCGLVELLEGKSELPQAVGFDAETGLSLLPSMTDSRLVHSDEILSSDAFKRLVNQLRQQYDFVILDLPPLASVVDARAAAEAVDSFIYVVEWGRTRIKVVEGQLNAAPEVRDRLLGVVLNKVDVRVLQHYEYHYSNLYQSQSYARYGHGRSLYRKGRR
jgi:succinoglycan biosynthesis transport protein ExoP